MAMEPQARLVGEMRRDANAMASRGQPWERNDATSHPKKKKKGSEGASGVNETKQSTGLAHGALARFDS